MQIFSHNRSFFTSTEKEKEKLKLKKNISICYIIRKSNFQKNSFIIK